MVAKTAPLPHSLMVASATLSLPLAVIAMLLPVHTPLAGDVMLTVGGVVSPPPPPPFETVTGMAADAVRPAPSVTIRLSVWLPFGTPVVFQLAVAVAPLTLWLEIVVLLSSFSTNDVGEPCALVADIPTVTVPLTVAPLAGLVIAALRGGGVPPPPPEAPEGTTG